MYKCFLTVTESIKKAFSTIFVFTFFVLSQEIIITVIENNECICIALYDPVCGEDGQTYGNSCEAGCEDISIAYEGECEEITPCLGDFDIIEQEYIAGFACIIFNVSSS